MCAELQRAKRYRLIAEKLRTIADDHPGFRQALILTAEDYDGMAEAIEALCPPPVTAVSKHYPERSCPVLPNVGNHTVRRAYL